jgi:hypothetical protein
VSILTCGFNCTGDNHVEGSDCGDTAVTITKGNIFHNESGLVLVVNTNHYID